MTDVSQLSDSELLANLALPALRKRESSNRPGIQGPMTQWGRAQGQTQMLPQTAQATAAKIGVPWRPELMTGTTPEAAAYQDTLGRAYLQEGIEKTGSLDGGLRYYHGGPDKRQWGPKTDAYARAVLNDATGGQGAPQGGVSALSDAQLLAMLGKAPSKPAAPLPAKPLPQRAAAPQPVSKGTFWGDMADTVGGAWNQLKGDVQGDYRRTMARLNGPLPSLPQAARDFVGDLGSKARVVGDVLGLGMSIPNAPIQAAVVRPAARAIAQNGPQAYARPTFDLKTMKATAGAPLTKGQTELAAQDAINTALSAAAPAKPKAAPFVKPVPKTLDQVKAAKSAAYDAVDQSGFRFDPVTSNTMASDAMKMVADAGGKELYPKSAAMADRMQSVVARGDLSLTKLDKLRSQIGEVVQKDEPYMANNLRGVIDAYIDSTDAPEIRQARALHAQQMKMEAVTNAAESADLRASSTYAGGNKNNATRQNLRPLIDPKSPQRIRNFTPDEAAAANKAVRGGAGQNAVRLAGKMLDPRGLIGATLQGVMGVGSHGLSTASIPLGMAASEAGNAMTAKNVQDLIDLISIGGVKPVPPPVSQPMTSLVGQPAPSLLSFPGAVGVTEAMQPLLPKRGARSKAKTKTAKAAQR